MDNGKYKMVYREKLASQVGKELEEKHGFKSSCDCPSVCLLFWWLYQRGSVIL